MRSHPVAGQLFRFLIAGGLSTLIYTAVYLPLAMWVFARGQAVLAVPFAFAAAVSAGYFLHSNWSFRGHGARDRRALRQVKFVGVQGVGLGLHALITWIVTGPLAQPAWVPLIPGLLIVPVVTFLLNRQWVFR
jgi:putative flippase GtrA